MAPEPDALPESRGLRGKIVVMTAFLVAVAALIDAATAVATKTQSLICRLAISLPWCEAPSPGKTGPEPPVIPATRVNAFTIMAFNSAGLPAGGMQSARRDWERVTPDRWVEKYPGGIPSYFDVVGRITLNGCPGTVVRNEADQSHWAFIPDKGCEGMPFYISDDNKNWGIASAMIDVQ
jgi:hypothetical protein